MSIDQTHDRSKMLTGTDIAAILGLSPYKTPMQVWAEKTGRVQAQNIDDKLCVRLGIKLEDTVAQLFSEETGKKVYPIPETLFHPQYSFLAGHIDRKVEGENALLECKTTSPFRAKEWDDYGIPPEYVCQVYHYLAITGHEKAYIACLIGNHKFEIREVPRDQKTIDALIEKEVSFWNDYVLADKMPPMISCNDTSVLLSLFPQTDPSKIITLDDNTDNLIESLESYKQDLKSLEATIEQQENQLKLLMGNAEIAKSNRYKLSWKMQSRKTLDTTRIKKEKPELYEQYAKETSTRVFKISPLKEELAQ